MSNNLFHGKLTITIPEQIGLTSAQRSMIRESYGDGQDLPQKVRYACAIAEAMNETIKDGIEVGGQIHLPNPKVRAQFGKNRKGLPYLTVGLIDPDGKTWTLTWQGGDVPVKMAVTALKHDQGKRTKTIAIPLTLEGATVYETGAKRGKRRNDPRRNHDTAKDGNPYPRAPRTSHNRLCEADVKLLVRQIATPAT
jgi:hypothetical protein